MGLGLVSRETKEGGRIIVEVDGKVAKIRNLKVSLKLYCFLFPLRSLYYYRGFWDEDVYVNGFRVGVWEKEEFYTKQV